jgi:hypothetical protein
MIDGLEKLFFVSQFSQYSRSNQQTEGDQQEDQRIRAAEEIAVVELRIENSQNSQAE